MRGIAALLVVLGHSVYLLSSNNDLTGLRDFLSMGGVGVDLFFMISGFIMVHTTWGMAGGPRDSTEFLLKRFVRIWPAYAFWTAAWICLSQNVDTPPTFREVAESLLFLPEKLEKPPFYGYPTLIVGWTLNYEMLFYGLFALSMLFRRLRFLVLTVAFLALVYVLPALKGEFTLYTKRPPIFESVYLDFATNPILLEFAFGALVGIVYRFFRFPTHILSAIALLSAAALGWQLSFKIAAAHGFAGSGITVAPLFFSLIMLEKNAVLRSPAWLAWVGNLSYSLYLAHLVVINVVTATMFKLGLGDATRGWSMVFALAAISVVVAGASQFLLERHVSNYFKRLLLLAMDLPFTRLRRPKADQPVV